MINHDIASIFKEMSFFYEMEDDGFRARAYERGSAAISGLGRNLEAIYQKEGLKGLDAIPGIGAGMSKKIEEYIKNNHIKEYERMRKKTPIELSELEAVEGLGPKGIKTLYKKLGIKNLKDLEQAAQKGRIKKVEGFGAKSEENILESIAFVKSASGRMLLGGVWQRVEALVSDLRQMKEVARVSPAGSFRRRQETIGDIDILVSSENPKKVMDYFVAMPDVIRVWGAGPTKGSVRVRGNFDIDLRVVPRGSWGAALQYFTGSRAHNIKIRQIAVEKKLKLNEYGLYRGKKRIAGKSEEEIYEALGLAYPEPELREDAGEIELSAYGRSPAGRQKKTALPDIIKYGSLRGDLQIQTDWTDGAHSIEEMAKEAKRVGLKYIAITDHTKGLAMTGGSDEKKLLRQMRAIDSIQKRTSGIRILKGAEVNIQKDGSLDIQDEVLAQLDVVGASVHSFFKMSRTDMTKRITRAIENPHVDILFHPTGRIIQKRPAYELDMQEVIKKAVQTGTLLEINAQPVRLDLKDSHIRMGVEAGARFVVNSDAHHKNHFSYLDFGVAQARRGWAEARDVLNTLPVEQFLKKLKK